MIGPGYWTLATCIAGAEWAIGYILMVFLAQITGDWRLFNYVILAIGVPAFILNWTQSESARWLAVSGKIDEATKIFKKIGRSNARDVENLVIYHKGEDKNDYEDAWYHIFTNRKVRFRVVFLSLVFALQNFVYKMGRKN